MDPVVSHEAAFHVYQQVTEKQRLFLPLKRLRSRDALKMSELIQQQSDWSFFQRSVFLRPDVNPILDEISSQFDMIDSVLTNPELRWQRRQATQVPRAMMEGETSKNALDRVGAVRDEVIRHPASKIAVDRCITQYVNFDLRSP